MSFVSGDLATGSFFPHLVSGPGGFLYALVLALVALGLMFAGRSIVKALAFLVVGFAGAAFGLAVGAAFLGPVGAIIGGVICFVLGGLIGLLLVHVGMGLALGYFGYLAVRYLSHSFPLSVAAGVILFLVGVAVSSKLMELVTAVLGGVVFYGVLVFFGVAPFYAGLISLVFAVAGFVTQRNQHRYEGRWSPT